MAKDPAFLFYPGDWQGGTMTFSRFLKGCYMDILIAQFNSGHLSLEEIKTVLGSDFGQAWPTLQKKFKHDDNGLFFNEKMETEMIKRKEYSKSRADNRRKKEKTDMKHICKTYDNTYVLHMENENENENTVNGALIKNVPRERFSVDGYESGQQMFEEVRDDEIFLERLLRIVHTAGFISCQRLLLLKAVRFFITREAAKPDFKSQPRSEHKRYLVNWVTTKATTLNQYA